MQFASRGAHVSLIPARQLQSGDLGYLGLLKDMGY